MGNCGANADSKGLIENFFSFQEDKFISYLQTEYFRQNDRNKPEQNPVDNPIDTYDDTILHYAVYHNKERIIDFLLSKEADPMKKNKRNQSPYYLAKKKNMTSILEKFEPYKKNK